MNAGLDDRYFDWLYSQVCSPLAENPGRTYRDLLHILFTKEFVWLVPNDDNRVEDGQDLRTVFLHEEGIELYECDQMWLELGCSMLELLVSLSQTLEFQAEGSVPGWFWELMENLDLHTFSDAVEIPEDYVRDVLDRVIWRTYDRDGHGGLFPLKSARQDQRKVELWYQLSAYILERS